jgi:hypothetical protein
MSVSALPRDFDYTEPHPRLPDGMTNSLVSLSPVNGQTFGAQSQIYFDFLTGAGAGFIDPKSLYIRYKYTFATAAGAQMLGVPVYTPFLRLETVVNGSFTLETMNQYNQTCNDLITFSMDHAQRFGKAPMYGFTGSSTGLSNANPFGGSLVAATVLAAAQNILTLGTILVPKTAGTNLIKVGDIAVGQNIAFGTTVATIVDADPNWTITLSAATSAAIAVGGDVEFYSTVSAGSNLQNTFGRVLKADETGFFSAPLPCYLSNCQQPIPAFFAPFRIVLTLDSIANMFTAVVQPTAITLANCELCYNKIHIDGLEDAIRRIPRPIYIKTQSFYNVATTLGTAASGNIALVYNTRFLSAKAIFCRISGGTNTSNKVYDAIDITSTNGDYSLLINGMQYPQRVLSTSQNKAGIMTELLRAVSNVFSNDSCAIDVAEWERTDATGTTFQTPGKFYIGWNLQKWNYSNGALFTGIPSANSPITLYINCQTQTTNQHSVNLIFNYDCILEIDPQTLQIKDTH